MLQSASLTCSCYTFRPVSSVSYNVMQLPPGFVQQARRFGTCWDAGDRHRRAKHPFYLDGSFQCGSSNLLHACVSRAPTWKDEESNASLYYLLLAWPVPCLSWWFRSWSISGISDRLSWTKSRTGQRAAKQVGCHPCVPVHQTGRPIPWQNQAFASRNSHHTYVQNNLLSCSARVVDWFLRWEFSQPLIDIMFSPPLERLYVEKGAFWTSFTPLRPFDNQACRPSSWTT